MATSSRPSKRARTDSQGLGEQPPNVQPSSQEYERGGIWFEDGNIILVSQGTAFRVHMGILSKNSVIFQDMFTFPQPADGEAYEGCPVVHLTDSKEDVARLLAVLFDFGNQYAGFQRTLPFLLVSTMLRLGTKYQIDHLREDAICRLRQVFPAHLDDFRNWYTLGNDADKNLAEMFYSKAIHMSHEDVIAVVNLARTFNIDQILPPVFYICAQLTLDELILGHVDEDGTKHELSREDLVTILTGADKLRRRSLDQDMFIMRAQPSVYCTQQESCIDALVDSRASYPSDSFPAVLGSANWITNEGLCTECTAAFSEEWLLDRRAIWWDLAVIFGLRDLEWPGQQ